MPTRTVDLGKVVGPAGPNEVSSSTDTALNGVLFGNGSKVGAKSLDTSSLTNDNDHVPTSGVVKSALIFVPETGNAGWHNSIYRGKYLGTSVTAAQYAAISAGTFDDLFIGDYWTINSVNWRIAAFDYWLHTGDTECTTHHAVIVPDSSLHNAKMNSTNTTTGGYMGSNFYTGANGNTGKSSAITKVNNAFGSSHILSHRELLTNAVTSGAASGWNWANSTVELMNESMVYGHNVFVGSPVYESGVSRKQLPLFTFNSVLITIRSDWWLRGVGNAREFCYVGAGGQAIGVDAATTYPVGVRPAFAIKA